MNPVTVAEKTCFTNHGEPAFELIFVKRATSSFRRETVLNNIPLEMPGAIARPCY